MADVKRHELKTWPQPFEAVATGRKTFEFRRDDDRGFVTGDELLLREYDYEQGQCTGRELVATAGYILRPPEFGMPADRVAISLLDVRPVGTAPEPATTTPADDVTGRLAQVFHPGEYIEEELRERCWTVDSLSERSGLEPYRLQAVIDGAARVTAVVAHCVGKAFDTGPEIWLNLQRVYDERRKESGS